MKNMVKNITFILIFLCITIGIFKFHYDRNYKVRTSPPSNLYSKEVKIDSVMIKGSPSLLTTDDGYVVAYTSDNKVFLLKLDKYGKKVKKIELNGYSEYINDVNLVHGKNMNYLVFTTYFKGEKKLIQISFDNQLNNRKETNEGVMKFAKRINDDSLVFCCDDKVIFKNLSEGYSNVLNYSKTSMISGTKKDDSYYVQMMDSDGNLNMVEISKGKIIKKSYYRLSVTSSLKFPNMITTTDNRNIYSLFEVELKGQEQGVYMVTFPEKDGKATCRQFYLNNEKYYYNLIPACSSKDGNFLAITSLPTEGSEASVELAEISIKDGEVNNIIKATRMANLPYSPSYSQDSLIFMSIEDDSKPNIYIESKNEDFKNINNKITAQEKKNAIIDTIGDELTSVAFVPVLGISWLFLGAFLVGILTFIEWKANSLAEDIFLYISYIITAIFKTYIIYKAVYVLFGQATGIMANRTYGCLSSLGISLICLIFLIYKQKNSKQDIAYFVFFIPLIIDTILTQILFVPYL